MMNEMNIKKMEELLANEEFAQKTADAGSYENAYQLFTENGVDASYEDFMAYIEDCRKVMVEKGLISDNGELSVEMLDMISGGGIGLFLLGTIGGWLITKALDNAWSSPNCPVPPCNCSR